MMLDEVMGSKSGPPRIPYSVSIPRTLAIALGLEILPRAHVLDRATTLHVVFFSVDQRADENDPLALLARDSCPVVGVGGVGKVFVLAELLTNRFEEVVLLESSTLARDLALHGDLLGPSHNVLDHGARSEVLEVQDFFIAALIGDFQESILIVDAEHV